MQPLIDKIGKDKVADFKKLTDTIGGIIIWPAKKIDNKITINGHRGFSPKIADRLDLTMECLRRYYLGQDSPLFKTFPGILTTLIYSWILEDLYIFPNEQLCR